MADDDRERLADYIRARRQELGLTREQLAMRIGVSYRTVGEAERRKPVAQDTLTAIDAGLGWPPGACRRILSGGEPEPGLPAAARSLGDPTLDYLSRTPGIPDEVRNGLIGMVRGWRDTDGGKGQASG